MKVTSILFILSLLTLTCFGQNDKAVLTLTNGDILQVTGQIKDDYFVYDDNNDSSKRIHFSDLDHAKIKIDDTLSHIFKYVKLKVKKKERFEVVQEILNGKVSLFIATNNAYAKPFSAGMGRMPYQTETHYVKRVDEEAASQLGSNEIFGKSFRKAALQYFSDCNLVLEKIESREFIKAKIIELVDFYNKKCNYTIRNE